MVRTKSVDRSCESQNLENKNSKNECKSKTRSATQPNKNNSKKLTNCQKKLRIIQIKRLIIIQIKKRRKI